MTDEQAARERLFKTDERAVSTTLSYVLTLSITAILASGLLIAAGTFVDNRQEEVARDELEVVGEQLASRLMAADRLAASGADEVVVTTRFPETIAGSRYRIDVQPGSDRIVLTATSIDAQASVSYTSRTTVADVEVSGGELRIVLTPADELEVKTA